MSGRVVARGGAVAEGLRVEIGAPGEGAPGGVVVSGGVVARGGAVAEGLRVEIGAPGEVATSPSGAQAANRMPRQHRAAVTFIPHQGSISGSQRALSGGC